MYLPSLIALSVVISACAEIGRECSVTRTRACSLEVLHFVFHTLPTKQAVGLCSGSEAPLHLAFVLSRYPAECALLSWHVLQRKCTNGDTDYMSCREFPAKYSPLLVSRKMGSCHYIIYKMDYFYGFMQTKFCIKEQDSFLLSVANIMISIYYLVPVHCCWVGFYLPYFF